MENKTVTLNSNLTVGDDFRLRRINVYDDDLKRRVDQDGQTRSLEEFDWKSLPETASREVIKQGHEIFSSIINRNRKVMKRKLEAENSPYVGLIEKGTTEKVHKK